MSTPSVSTFVNPSLSPPLPPAQEEVRGLLPFVLAAAGHRDLREQDVPILEAQVRALLLELRQRYPDTPLVLLTALAEGADCLIARIAIQCDCRLVVPLPLPLDVYEAQFSAPEARVTFHALLAQADGWFVLPAPPGVTAEDLRRESALRDAQYARLAAFLADRAHALLALWDGHPTPHPGGTAQIAAFMLHGVPDALAPPCRLLDAPDTGPVYHLRTPRRSRADTEGEPLTLTIHFNPGLGTPTEAQTALDEIVSRIDAFNQDARRLAPLPAFAEARKSSEADLPTGNALAALSSAQRAPLENIRHQYALANALSMRFERLTLDTIRLLTFITFTAGVCIALARPALHSGSPTPAHISAFVAGIALAIVAYLLFLRARKANIKNKYQDYRALAEGLRVQFYWDLLNLSETAADHYLYKQENELDWIRIAIRAWDVPRFSPLARSESNGSATQRAQASQGGSEQAKSDAQDGQSVERLRTVQAAWVEGQRRYFERSAARAESRLTLYSHWGMFCFLTSAMLAVVNAAVSMMHGRANHVLTENWPYAILLFSSYPKIREMAPKIKQPGSVIGPGQRMSAKATGEAASAVPASPSPGRALLAALYKIRFALLTVCAVGLIAAMHNYIAPAAKPEDAQTVAAYWLEFALVIVLGIALLLENYADKTAMSGEMKAAQRMSVLFTRASQRLRELMQAGDTDQARRLALELGEEALAENGDWVLLHRGKPIEPPKPGTG